MGDDNNRYTGTFDGAGHVIYNLSISSNEQFVGFFGHIKSDGAVKNLTLYEPNVSGVTYAGAIAGYNTGSISGCSVSGGTVTSSGNESLVGGVVGWNSNGSGGTVENCTNSATVSSTGNYARVGGIVGNNNNNGTVSGCSNSGDVTAEGNSSYAGGVVGYNYSSGTVSGCSNSGDVTAEGTASYAGGVVGYNYDGGTVDESSCSNTGTVSATGDNSKSGDIIGNKEEE